MDGSHAISGSCSAAVSPATASSRVNLGVSVPSGKTFWLKGVSTSVNATTGPLILTDATVGSTATTPELALPMATAAAVRREGVGYANIGEPGIKFTTDCCGFMAASGSIAIGECTVWGFIE